MELRFNLGKYFLLFSVLIFSCRNVDSDKGKSSDVVNDSIGDVKISRGDSINSTKNTSISLSDNSQPEIGLPPADSRANEIKKTKNSSADIQITTFRNENLNGYGYDIILNGHVYVHQPNIPALPGNNGFANIDQAKKVAEFVVNKIRHNILPPTLSAEELDSLGIK